MNSPSALPCPYSRRTFACRPRGLRPLRLRGPYQIRRPMIGEPLQDSAVGIRLAVSAALPEVYKERSAVRGEVADSPEAYASPACIAQSEGHQCHVQGVHALTWGTKSSPVNREHVLPCRERMTYADAILAALARSGRSGREVSIAAVGHESAIRSLKRGMDVRTSTLLALCEELGLEFYVGPPRPRPAVGGYDASIREREPPPTWVTQLTDDLRSEIRHLAARDRNAGRGAQPEFVEPSLAADVVWSAESREIPGVRCVDCYEVQLADGSGTVLDDSTAGRLPRLPPDVARPPSARRHAVRHRAHARGIHGTHAQRRLHDSGQPRATAPAFRPRLRGPDRRRAGRPTRPQGPGRRLAAHRRSPGRGAAAVARRRGDPRAGSVGHEDVRMTPAFPDA